jgi:hypothetical protein
MHAPLLLWRDAAEPRDKKSSPDNNKAHVALACLTPPKRVDSRLLVQLVLHRPRPLLSCFSCISPERHGGMISGTAAMSRVMHDAAHLSVIHCTQQGTRPGMLVRHAAEVQCVRYQGCGRHPYDYHAGGKGCLRIEGVDMVDPSTEPKAYALSLAWTRRSS